MSFFLRSSLSLSRLFNLPAHRTACGFVQLIISPNLREKLRWPVNSSVRGTIT